MTYNITIINCRRMIINSNTEFLILCSHKTQAPHAPTHTQTHTQEHHKWQGFFRKQCFHWFYKGWKTWQASNDSYAISLAKYWSNPFGRWSNQLKQIKRSRIFLSKLNVTELCSGWVTNCAELYRSSEKFYGKVWANKYILLTCL